MSLTIDAMVRANLPLLRRLRDQDFDSLGALAEGLARDKSNLSKTVQKLRVEGLVNPAALGLTRAGDEALAALEAESGAAAPPPRMPASNAFIPLDLIDRDPALNPRKTFNEADLQALADSIADKGVVQPILIRPAEGAPGRYRLVAGERRFRASQLAGLDNIPAVVRDLTDAQALEIALIENIQRVDLSPIEEARAFKRIVEARQAADPSLSQRAAAEVIVEATRKSLRFIEQRLQLLQLSDADQDRMDLPEDNAKHLTVTEARKIIQSRPPKVEPNVLLVLAELSIADDAIEDGHPIVDDLAMLADAAWAPLANSYKVYGPSKVYGEDGQWTGEYSADVGYGGYTLLRAHCPAFFDEDKTARDTFVADLRAQVLGDRPFNGPCVTPWLNGPFPISDERRTEVQAFLAQVAADVERRAEQSRLHDEQQARNREIGEGALAKANQLTLAMRAAPPSPIAPILPETLAQMGYKLPFHIQNDSLLDAEGQFLVSLRHGYGGLSANARATIQLVADAINGACGLATPELDDGQAKTREQFIDWLTDRFVTMHGATLEAGAENAGKALTRVLESEQTDFGDAQLDWSEEAAEIIADGWAEDGDDNAFMKPAGDDQVVEDPQFEEAE